MGHWPGFGVWCLLGLKLLTSPVWAQTPDYALHLPKAGESLLLDIAAAGHRLVAVGERGHVLYSNDGGDSWVQAEVPTTVMLTRVFFIDDRRGWAVGHDGNILASRDGGVSWELQRHGMSDQAQINEARAGRARRALGDLRDQVAVARQEERAALQGALEEAKYQWDTAREALDSPVYAPPLMDAWFADENQGWASGAYGTLLRTGNGGRDWADWSHKADNPDELHLNGVVGTSDGQLFLASEWGIVFRSTTGGETWEQLETGYDGSFFGLLVSPTSGSVFAYGLRGTVYRSTDGGRQLGIPRFESPGQSVRRPHR